jgi:hypothetical protein
MVATYKIGKDAAERLADEFDAMSPQEKAQYPEMARLARHLRREALVYGRALIAIADCDCVPYPGASDMCKAGDVFTDTFGRRVISDGYGTAVQS